MDLGAVFKLKQMWSTFTSNHPNFPPFLNALKSKGIQEGTQMTITVQYPDGTELKSGLKLKASDIDLINTIQNMR